MIFIAYYLSPSDGIGSARSLYLLQMLKEHGIKITTISRDTYCSTNKLIWILNCCKFISSQTRTVIYISCGPFWYLLPIALLSYLLGHKLVVDFRDPWSLNIKTGYGSGICSNNIKLCIAEFIEKIVYRISYKIIVCTPGMKMEYGKLFSDMSKIEIVLNGHMVPKQMLFKIRDDKRIVRVVCVGKFACYCKNADKILDEIGEKLDILGKNYRIDFYDPDTKLLEIIKNRKNIYVHSRINYAEVMKVLQRADIGLCAVRNEEYEFGTKIFDYIAFGIPVYDCFTEGSSFKNYFKDYLISDLNNLRPLSCDKEEKFSRYNNLKYLVDIIEGV